jgi:hypothetical protein
MSASRRRTVIWVLVTLAALVIPAVVTYVRNEASLRPRLDRQVRFFNYRTGERPILADLAGGRVRPGDSIETVIATHPPDRVVRHGEYVTASYTYGGPHQWVVLVLIAKHGRLASAKLYSAIENDEFFHDQAAVGPDYSTSYSAEISRQSLEAYEIREAVRLSVAGFGAVHLQVAGPGEVRPSVSKQK